MTTFRAVARQSGLRDAAGWSAASAAAALLLMSAGLMALQAPGQGQGEMERAVLIDLQPPIAPHVSAIPTPAPEAQASAPTASSTPPPPERNPTRPTADAAPAQTAPMQPPKAVVTPDAVARVASDVPAPEPAPATQPHKPRRVGKTEPRPEATASEANAKPAAPSTASVEAAPESRATKAGAGSGQASAASYDRAVLKKINRTRRMAAPARGTAVVGFRIGRDGGLASASVIQSSGSSDLDALALDHIRRSAPFPAPPEGAKRSFSFAFTSKG